MIETIRTLFNLKDWYMYQPSGIEFKFRLIFEIEITNKDAKISKKFTVNEYFQSVLSVLCLKKAEKITQGVSIELT